MATLLSLGALGCDPVVVDVVRAVEDAGVGVLSVDAAPFYETVIHRYSFDGNGDTVIDVAGGADGVVVDAPLAQASGDVLLEGQGGYVSLPSGLLSNMESATLETWLTWMGATPWQRIFDIGSGGINEVGDPYGVSYLFATPSTTAELGEVVRVAHRRSREAGVVESIANGARPLPTFERTCVAVVVDARRQQLSLYVNGRLESATELTDPLSTLQDEDAWLGRSHFVADADFVGSFHEFRIYASALTSEQIRESFEAGPDASFVE